MPRRRASSGLEKQLARQFDDAWYRLEHVSLKYGVRAGRRDISAGLTMTLAARIEALPASSTDSTAIV